ncbi:hypothetical protein LOCC1_G008547 [Lachnellula occidentalis]|uniref:Uncharacterized protein n=1 Tax=Lachnellula occidentalis TaxID=215460 RepID=A0A8H8U5N8_9HELO|nr:hypothetical protein LOCC1_G008547 [Lachnellula occidentalis]
MISNRKELIIVFIINKKQLSLQLYKDSKITTLGKLFEASRYDKIEGLIGSSIFRFKQFNTIKHTSLRIFNSRIVDKVKGKAIEILYKKSRLII